MTNDISWIAGTGLDTEAGIGYTGSVEKYISALSRFYRNYSRNITKINEYLNAEDYESYMITVHALKSNARMIGAGELSGLFEVLEDASREGLTDVIKTQNPAAMTSYEALIQRLEPVNKIKDAAAPDEISANTARETVTKLLEALDDFDDEEAKRLAKKLSGYPFRLTQANKLKEAIAFIEDFMYDEAADIIREITPSIE